MPWVRNFADVLDARKNAPKTRREMDKETKRPKHRFDEVKIHAAHTAYLKEKEQNKMNSNQYGYAGRLRRVEG